MQHVQPLLRLTVLLVAALQGRAEGDPYKDLYNDSETDSTTAAPAARYDYSRYFGGGAARGGVGGPGGGTPGGLGAAKAATSDTGFVEPVDFKSFFGGVNSFGGPNQQRQQASPFFGASAQSGSLLPFGSSPFGAVGASEEDGFLHSDFKSKRGAGRGAGLGGLGGHQAAETRDRDHQSDDFFSFDFPEGGGGGDKADFLDEDAEDRDEVDDDDHRDVSRPQKASNARYPSYSSYYHNTQPEKIKAQEQQEDDFGFDEDEGAAAEDIREPSSPGASASGATSAEAYNSRPYQDGQDSGSATRAARAGPPLGLATGPSRIQLQGGFVPSPVDPLRDAQTDPLRTQASQSSRAASHAAVHAAVKAAHRAASAASKRSAGAGAGPGAAGLGGAGSAARSYAVRRTREEPDDAFFESYSLDDKDDQDKEADDKDDYRFGPEYFTDEDDAPEGGGEAAEGAASSGGEGQSAAATGGRCTKVVKKGSTCMVCTDPNTGGNYEQCQYATEPETQSYSFGRSSSYGNPRSSRRRREEGPGKQSKSSKYSKASKASKASKPSKEAEQPEDLYDQDEQDTSLEKINEPKYEDYFSFLFPELTKDKNKRKNKKKGSKKKSQEEDSSDDVSSLLSHLDEEDPFAAESTAGAGVEVGAGEDIWLGPPAEVTGTSGVGVAPKKDLERMLGEFQQKDRSDCTKVEKDHMTCYQCVDKKGMQHEECMFVAASEPKQSHLAYHQSSEFKKPATSTATSSTTTTAAPPKSSKSGKGAKSKSRPSQNAAASNTATSTVRAPTRTTTTTTTPAPGPAKSRPQRAAEEVKQDKKDEDGKDEEEKEELNENDDEDDEKEPVLQEKVPDDGMFSEETKPVFDKALKMSLPKYMLERTEHERVFDEVLASGA